MKCHTGLSSSYINEGLLYMDNSHLNGLVVIDDCRRKNDYGKGEDGL